MHDNIGHKIHLDSQIREERTKMIPNKDLQIIFKIFFLFSDDCEGLSPKNNFFIILISKFFFYPLKTWDKVRKK